MQRILIATIVWAAASAACAALRVKLALVAPLMFTVFLRHWYVRFAPVAVTLNVAGCPAHTVCAVGCVVIAVAALMVSATALEVTVPQLFVTMTS